MGYINRVSAMVHRMERDGDTTRLVLIGTAFVGEDGKTLANELDETVTIGPDTPLVVRGI